MPTIQRARIQPAPEETARSLRGSALPFTISATIFLVAAAIVTALRVQAPFPRGWWLVAYLSLVGGIAQLLLGPGLIAIARWVSAIAGSATPVQVVVRASNMRFVLWNLGTIIVAVTSMMGAPLGVPAGSILLLTALASFRTAARGLRDQSTPTNGRAPASLRAYSVLIWFMVLSTIVGNFLAYR